MRGVLSGPGVFRLWVWLMRIIDWHGWHGLGGSFSRGFGGFGRGDYDGIFCTFLLFLVSPLAVPVVGKRSRRNV